MKRKLKSTMKPTQQSEANPTIRSQPNNQKPTQHENPKTNHAWNFIWQALVSCCSKFQRRQGRVDAVPQRHGKTGQNQRGHNWGAIEVTTAARAKSNQTGQNPGLIKVTIAGRAKSNQTGQNPGLMKVTTAAGMRD